MSRLRSSNWYGCALSRRRLILRNTVEAMEARLLLSSASTGVETFAPASAAPTTRIVVNTAKDQTDAAGSKTVSLRDALQMAGHASGPVSIGFDTTVFAVRRTITLAGTQLELGGNTAGPITIQGPPPRVTISGNHLSRILVVDKGVTASMAGIDFTNGQSNNYAGGAINNSGNLMIAGSTISGNAGLSGGAIENSGNLSVRDSTIRSNSSNIAGGGIDNTGSLSIQNSTIDSNAAQGGGGGIESSGPVAVVDSTISGNNTTSGNGGGVDTSGIATLSNSTISGNYVQQGYRQEYASYGGGVANTGDITITNATISGNSTDDSGAGGIWNGGTARLFDSTVTENSSFFNDGGILNFAGQSFTIANTIVAANQIIDPAAGASGPDVAGDFSSSGHNLIGITDGSSGWVKSDFKGTAAVPINPRLSPLDFFGGPTRTQYPLTGSLAKLGGSAALVPRGVTTDQRGFARVVNGTVDIGAVELQHFATPVVTPAAKQNVTAGNPASIVLGSFTDPGGTGPFSVVVEWGDGSAHTYFNLNSVGSLGNQTHTFIKTGLLTVGVFVRDARGDLSQPKGIPIYVSNQPLLNLVVNTTSSQTHTATSTTVSLVDAIDRADQRYGPASITFDPAVFAKTQTIVLPDDSFHPQHNVFAPIFITGPSAGVILMGGGTNSGAVLQIAHGVTLRLSNVTVSSGGYDGIRNDGALFLTCCTISNNQGIYGGGIYNTGSLTITGSMVTGNTANYITGSRGGIDGGGGGGIYNLGALTVSDSTISKNTSTNPELDDGAIDSFGTLVVADSTISGNTGSGFVSAENPAIITNTHVIDNSDLGGQASDLTMTGCIISGNNGGGLSLSNATLSNSTISGNTGNESSGNIGGIAAVGAVTISNCTIANNSGADGGGILADPRSDVSLNDTTISGNSGVGGGIFSSPASVFFAAAIVRLANTIVVGNTNPNGGGSDDVSGAFSSRGFNLIGQTDGSSGWVQSDLKGTAAHPLLAKLSPLGPNGGPTPTEVPLPGSPALNHGSNALIPAGVFRDQRGMPRIAHRIVDIGAVEVQSG